MLQHGEESTGHPSCSICVHLCESVGDFFWAAPSFRKPKPIGVIGRSANGPPGETAEVI